MRKTGGAIAIALEPNNARESKQSQHRVSHPMSNEQNTMTPAENELQLIERAKRDPRAFAPLYNAYADMVWRIAMSRLGDPERARDVTSQTFVHSGRLSLTS